MKANISVVIDTSGSMAEWGKHFIARGVVRALEQYVRLGYANADLRLVVWSNEARVIEWRPDQELPQELLVSEGSANTKALVSLLGTEPGGKVLLLTDGFWSQADAKELKHWQERLQPDTLRIIKIGVDANPQLKGKNVFAAEDLFAALDEWLEGGVA